MPENESSYILQKTQSTGNLKQSLGYFKQFLENQWSKFWLAFVAVLLNNVSTVATPFLIGYAVDKYISQKNLAGMTWILMVLMGLYGLSLIMGYLQPRLVGNISQNVLFSLRNKLFDHLQNLPILFFWQNSTGDIISRLNNDTDKISQFLSQSVFQFIAGLVSFVGIGVFMLILNLKMGLVVWSAVILIAIANWILSPIARKTTFASLKSNGELSGQLNDDLSNFEAVVAFHKQHLMVTKFQQINRKNFRNAVIAQIMNGLFNPIYNFSGNLSQIITLAFGLYLISQNQLQIGFLISFILYSQKFYEPLRILGVVWGSFQEAISAWQRVFQVLKLKPKYNQN